jgi:Flp pilus assembly protein TadG
MLTRPRILGRFRRAEQGLAALEFALVLPVMIVLLFGMVELSSAVFCRTDVAQMASTVADLVAQKNSVSSSDIQNVYNAANIILYPYYKGGGNGPTIRITSVIYDTTGGTNDGTRGTVNWSCTQAGSGSLPAASNNVTLDKPLLQPGGSVLKVEVAYNYAPQVTQTITGPIQMKDAFYTKPRRVGQIPAPTTCP